MPTKPQLQEIELSYLHDQEFLKAKLHIQQQLYRLLELVAKSIQTQQHSFDLPAEVWQISPKISRGENYEHLPYLVLDYPRIFQQETTFAYRTMLWWGWGFSCTLHLGGGYWQQYRNQLLQNLPQLKNPEDWWVCVNESPWEYHYRPDNYISLQEYHRQTDVKDAVAEKQFFKLSRRLPLNRYQKLSEFSLNTLEQLARLLDGA